MKINSAALLRNCLTFVFFGSVFMPSAVYARSIGEDLVIGCRVLSPSASAPKTQEDAVFLGMCLGTAMSVQEDMKSELNLVIWYNNHRDQMEKNGIGSATKEDYDNTNNVFLSNKSIATLCIVSNKQNITPNDMAKAVDVWDQAHPNLAKQYSNPMLEMFDALSFLYPCKK